jgi:hypothetical protein
MKMHIVVLRDITANVYGQPNFVASIGAAIRAFADNINGKDPNNIVSQHPTDFEMYRLGTYDDELAFFDLLTRPEQIATGKNLIQNAN